jgi:hypothetical protein
VTVGLSLNQSRLRDSAEGLKPFCRIGGGKLLGHRSSREAIAVFGEIRRGSYPIFGIADGLGCLRGNVGLNGLLTDRLAEGLQERGAEVLSPRSPGEASGIVSFLHGDEDPEQTARRLRKQQVFVVSRRGGVRASPHFYNDDSDIDRLLAAL